LLFDDISGRAHGPRHQWRFSDQIRLEAASTEIIRFSGFVLRGRRGPGFGFFTTAIRADHARTGDIDIIGVSALGSFGQFGRLLCLLANALSR
jgi:hypothetical protein